MHGGGEAAARPLFCAHGHAPDWSLAIGDKLRFAAGRLRIDAPARPISLCDGSKRYAGAMRDRAIGVAVDVAVTPEVCRDAVSGMPYPSRVVVTVDGLRYRGCGGDPASLLRGGEWQVEGIAGEPAVRATATLNFGDDGRLSGRAGCNAYATTYALGAETLVIGPPLTTRMACAPALMAQELRFLDLLGAVRRFDIDASGALRLLDGSGREISARR